MTDETQSNPAPASETDAAPVDAPETTALAEASSAADAGTSASEMTTSPAVDDEETAPAEAASESTAVEAAPAAGAQDTGRRIDPAKLNVGGGPTRLRHGGRGAKSTRGDADSGETQDERKHEQRKPAKAAVPAEAQAGAVEAKSDTPAAQSDGGDNASRDNASRDNASRDNASRDNAPRDNAPRGEGGERKKRRRPNRSEKQEQGNKGGPRTPEPKTFSKAPPPAKEALVEFDYSGDFASMLEEAGPIKAGDFRTGDEVQATLISLGSESAFFDIGGNQEAYCSRADVQDDEGTPTLEVGETTRMFVTDTRGGIQVSSKLSRNGVDITMLESAVTNGIPVEGKVVGHNKGGLEIEVAGTRGFCPMGQADINFVEDPATFVGQTLTFLIKEVKEGGKNLLVSRRALLQKDRDEAKAKTLETLEVGSRVTGTVTRVQPFGAFVDLGGIDGMVPVSELSWGRVENVSDVIATGDRIEVEVTRMEPDPKRKGELRIGLSRRSVLGDPWNDNVSRLNPGASAEGKVTRTADFGAFVELFPGVEGLIHISELSHERVHRVEDVVKVGAPVTVRVLNVDNDARRISLSLKETRPEPAAGDVPNRGAKVTGTVERIERYGVFVALDIGVTGLLPASESGTERGTDLTRAFPLGTVLELSVIDVDERGRVKVSKIARVRQDERDVLDTYQKSVPQAGSMGTLGDLFAKLRP